MPRTSFARMGLDLPLDFAKDHCRFIAKTFKEQQDLFFKKLEERTASVDAEYLAEYNDFLHDEHFRLHEMLPDMQWKAQFIYVMSLFESMMDEVCGSARSEHALSISHEDKQDKRFSGTGIDRCKSYLSKIFNIRIFEKSDWGTIGLLKTLRNKIVHANGRLRQNDPRSLELMHAVSQKFNTFAVVDHNHQKLAPTQQPEWVVGTVVLDSVFVIEAIDVLQRFIDQLCDQPVPSVSEPPAQPHT